MTANTTAIKFRKFNKYKLWIWALFFSFAYEKQVFNLTAFNRFNPRLFDFVIIAGLFIVFTQPTSTFIKNSVFNAWKQIIIWFTICAIVSLVFYPFPADKKFFILYYLFEYYKGILVFWIFIKIPTKYYNLNTIVNAIISGGIFVAFYSIYELFGGVQHIIKIGDKVFNVTSGLIWGPYTSSYFEIANYLPLVFAISFARVLYFKGKNIYQILITIFISWPLFFTGSRTAIGLLLLTFFVYLLFIIRKRFFTIVVFISILFVMSIMTNAFDVIFDTEMNKGMGRILALEESNNTKDNISSRLTHFESFGVKNYDMVDYLPFFGGGFYVCPVNGNYRIGYGTHNIFLFPFEQAGVIGFVLFIIFIVIVIKSLKSAIKKTNKESIEYLFILAILSYFIALLIGGVAGHTFWRGFATDNINSLKILVLMVATSTIFKLKNSQLKNE